MPQFLHNYCFYVDVTIEILYVCCIYQFYETYAPDTEIVSTVLRQIAPKAEEVFRDQYVLEFIGADADRLENSMRQSLIQQMKREIFENTTE